MAARRGPAVRLADGDGESVKLIEELRTVLSWSGGEGLAGEVGEGFIAFAIAALRRDEELMAFGDAA